METRDNSVINALKRLERAGSEHSRTTARLIDSTQTLAAHIVSAVSVDSNENLPRGYRIAHVSERGDSAAFLQGGFGSNLNCRGRYIGGHWYDSPNRDEALSFARDVATGWLDELAEWLLKRTDEDNDAVLRLETAARAIEAAYEHDEEAEREATPSEQEYPPEPRRYSKAWNI